MLHSRLGVSALIMVSLCCQAHAAAQEPEESPFQFEIETTDRSVVRIAPNPSGFTVVCFLGAECPMARLYGPTLCGLSNQFADRGVRFVGINSNRQDSMQDVRDYVSDLSICFPVGKDYDNRIADRFAAERTPEVFVIDAQTRLRYRGRIDDQYQPGIAKAKPTHQELRTALEQLLNGQPVSTPSTKATGCVIGRVRKPRANSEVTFCNQISRVLNNHCVECHRPGEIGPFSLLDYDEVAGWADTILEVIDDGRMPPWHASPAHGEFANARHVPKSDKLLLRRWVEAGSPYGDAKQLPPPPRFVDGWHLPREPDLVLSMRSTPFQVPAEGTVEYQYFVVDPEFSEDRWVSAAQVIPGSRAVVHHALVFIRPPDGSAFRGVGWLGAYVPGQRHVPLPTGSARYVPAGSKLVFQMHYTPNGTEQPDLTRLGLVFGNEDDVTHEVITVLGIEQEFEIPPHSSDHKVTGKVGQLPDSGELISIMPHMHLRGKSFQLVASQGGETSTLLSVPKYDFNWQHIYRLRSPLPLDQIDSLQFAASFDNSAGNPVNPDPTECVTWGDQTWQEMAVAFLEVLQPRDTAGSRIRSTAPPEALQRDERAHKARVNEFVDRFIKRFDSNRNGTVERDETPISVRSFGFWRFDNNRDDILTRTEVEHAARRRVK